MIKGLTNTKLAIILGGLVVIYVITQFTGGKERSKSFRESLVEIDTSKVSSMEITKEGSTLKINRVSAGGWEVELEGGKRVSAKTSAVKSSINNLVGIKPSRLAAKDPAKWKDYQVDSSGVRVKVMEDNKTALDIILGRFGVKDQRSYHTFVRLSEEDEVYTVDNFMGVSFSNNSVTYREQMFFRTKKDSIYSIEYNYPDSSFVLNNADDQWIIDGIPTDSSSTAEYFNGFNYTTSKNFVDDVDNFGAPIITVTIKANGEEDLVLTAYQLIGRQIILNSSLNPDAYFEDASLRDKFLKGKSYFLGD